MEHKEEKIEGIIDKEIEIDNRKIIYSISGNIENKTLIFLHGMPGNTEMKNKVVKELSSDYFVIAPDHPGLSKSEPLKKYTNIFNQYAEIVYKILERENLNKKSHIVMGQSLGGIIASTFAEKYKSNTSALILTDCQMGYQKNDFIRKILFNLGSLIVRGYYISPNIIRKQGLKIFFGVEGDKSKYKELIKNRFKMIDNICFLFRRSIKQRVNLLDREYNKDLPIILLWGDNDGKEFNRDGYSRAEDAQRLYDKFKRENRNVRFILMNGGHTVLYQKTEEVALLLKKELSGSMNICHLKNNNQF